MVSSQDGDCHRCGALAHPALGRDIPLGAIRPFFGDVVSFSRGHTKSRGVFVSEGIAVIQRAFDKDRADSYDYIFVSLCEPKDGVTIAGLCDRWGNVRQMNDGQIVEAALKGRVPYTTDPSACDKANIVSRRLPMIRYIEEHVCRVSNNIEPDQMGVGNLWMPNINEGGAIAVAWNPGRWNSLR